MMNDFFSATCPLCGAADLAVIGEIRYQPPVRFSTTEIRLERIPELWRCRRCRSGFVQNVLPEAVAAELYALGDSTSRWPTAQLAEGKSAEVLTELSRLCNPGTSVLDVGSNCGDLLDFARARGCVTGGAEYSSQAREELLRRGHTAYPSLDAVTGAFDLITALDVVEHLYDVREFFETCRSLLRQGGRLLVLTGDIGCTSARMSGRDWWYVAYPEHIVFPSLRFFEHFSGYSVERSTRTWAAPGYCAPWIERLRALALGLARGRYQGLPALGPDHILATLRP